jgi:superfamily II DNA/RNA helicase
MGVDRLVEQLAAVGVRAGALHGGKTQRVRTRTLAEFKEGRTNVLVATDVAARGIHVDGISLVVHVDPPKDPKDYLHRAGRTARAGESGGVVTLVLPKQRRTTQAMMAKAGVHPAEIRVRLGDDKLTEITGAREPSGVPVVEEPEPRRQPKRFGDRPQRGGHGFRGSSDRGARSFGDRERSYRGERTYGSERRGGERPQGERAYGDRPATDRPATDRPIGDRGYAGRPGGDRGYTGRPAGDRGHAGRPSGDRTYGDRVTDRGFGDRERGGFGDRPRGDRSFGDRSFGDRERGGFGDRPRGDRSFGDRGGRNGERPGGFRRDGQRNDRRDGTTGRFGTTRPARTF